MHSPESETTSSPRVVSGRRGGHRPVSTRSNATAYSCAYQVDIQQLDELDLTQLRVPELPAYVREAFRLVARGDVEGVKASLQRHENLVCCINAGGQTLLEVAAERGHAACVEILKTMERDLMRVPRFDKDDFPLLQEEDEEEISVETLEEWLKRRGLSELYEAIVPLAAEVSDLPEMLDEDIDELFASLSADLKRRHETALRRSLIAAGATGISSLDDDDKTLVTQQQPTSPPASAHLTPPPPFHHQRSMSTDIYSAVSECGCQIAGLVFAKKAKPPISPEDTNKRKGKQLVIPLPPAAPLKEKGKTAATAPLSKRTGWITPLWSPRRSAD